MLFLFKKDFVSKFFLDVSSHVCSALSTPSCRIRNSSFAIIASIGMNCGVTTKFLPFLSTERSSDETLRNSLQASWRCSTVFSVQPVSCRTYFLRTTGMSSHGKFSKPRYLKLLQNYTSYTLKQLQQEQWRPTRKQSMLFPPKRWM